MIAHIKVNHTPTQNTYKPRKTEYVHYGILKVLETWEEVSDTIKIKLCGVVLLLIGIVLIITFPEDNGGSLLACGIGLLVTLFYNGFEEL